MADAKFDGSTLKLKEVDHPGRGANKLGEGVIREAGIKFQLYLSQNSDKLIYEIQGRFFAVDLVHLSGEIATYIIAHTLHG